MQAAGMLRGIRAVYLLVFLISLIGYAHPFPLQLLPSIPGYIPVYIRHGDQPLDEINPALAEAFNEKTSSPKTVKLENIQKLADVKLEDDEANTYVGKSKKKNIHLANIRQVEASSAASDKDANKSAETNSDVEALKLLSIYELHDEKKSNGAASHRGNSMGKKAGVLKGAVVKVSPFLEAERENLERLTIQGEKEESRPNDLHDTSPSYPEPPRRVPHYFETMRDLFPLFKVGQIISQGSTEQPAVHLIKDLAQLSPDQDAPAAPVTEEEVHIKEQRPANVLFNVAKLSPIAVPQDSASRDASFAEETIESSQDDKSKELTERNVDITVS